MSRSPLFGWIVLVAAATVGSAGCHDSGFVVEWKFTRIVGSVISNPTGTSADVVTSNETCERYGVASVDFVAHDENGDWQAIKAPCGLRSITLSGLALGSYLFDCSALDASGGVVSTADMSAWENDALGRLTHDQPKKRVICNFQFR